MRVCCVCGATSNLARARWAEIKGGPSQWLCAYGCAPGSAEGGPFGG